MSPSPRNVNNMDVGDIILYVLAFLVPPFPVLIRKGLKTQEFFISLFLTFFFHLPGLLYALYIVWVTLPVTGEPRAHEAYQDLENQRHYQPLVLGGESQLHADTPEVQQPVPRHALASAPKSPFSEPVADDSAADDLPPAYDQSSAQPSTDAKDAKVQRP